VGSVHITKFGFYSFDNLNVYRSSMQLCLYDYASLRIADGSILQQDIDLTRSAADMTANLGVRSHGDIDEIEFLNAHAATQRS
jgi:hypothetical protein